MNTETQKQDGGAVASSDGLDLQDEIDLKVIEQRQDEPRTPLAHFLNEPELGPTPATAISKPQHT